MGCAKNDVEYHPNDQKPPRPIVAAEHEDPGKDGDKTAQANAHQGKINGTSPELREVIQESDRANQNEEPTDHRD